MMSRDCRRPDGWDFRLPAAKIGRRSWAALSLAVAVALAVLAVATLATAPVNAQMTGGICDRTPEVQNAILFNTGATTCSTVTDAQLALITELAITGYSSASIVPRRFRRAHDGVGTKD